MTSGFYGDHEYFRKKRGLFGIVRLSYKNRLRSDASVLCIFAGNDAKIQQAQKSAEPIRQNVDSEIVLAGSNLLVIKHLDQSMARSILSN